MKKRLISIGMALVFTLAPASAAFSDISDSEVHRRQPFWIRLASCRAWGITSLIQTVR